MRVSGIWKSRLSALSAITIMILVISGCTTRGNDSSTPAPDAARQIEDDGTAIYDDNPIAEEPQLDADELNGVTDGSNGQEQIISVEPYEGKNSAVESSISFGGVPPSDSSMDSSVFNDNAVSNVEYKNTNFINKFSEEPDVGSDGELPTTLIAVCHDDERKFTPEEWAEILEQIERGEVHWED